MRENRTHGSEGGESRKALLYPYRTVALAIPGMTCAACPITLKIALKRVTGVTAATVNFEQRQAVVTFDDAKTDVEALLRATGDAGYPSTVKELSR